MMAFVVAKGPILEVSSRLDMIWGWRTLRVPDWRLEGWGYLDLNIEDDVGGC